MKYLLVLFLIILCGSACDLSASLLTHDERENLVVDTQAHHTLQVAATSLSSDLAQRSIYASREGPPVLMKLNKNIDAALLALHHGQVHMAIYLASESSTSPTLGQKEHLYTRKLAQSNLWWTTQSHHLALSTQDWNDFLHARSKGNPHHLQLCLRTDPDPLEKRWLEENPQWIHVFQKIRQEKLWPVFHDETELINHLKENPYAVALMDEARLKLYALPLGKLQVQGHINTHMSILSSVNFNKVPHSLQTDIARWLSFIQSPMYQEFLQEWGWEP